MSCTAPQVYSAAGQRDPARAGAALSLALGVPALLVFLVAFAAPAGVRPDTRAALDRMRAEYERAHEAYGATVPQP
jgi:hypothetical protein